MKNLHKFQESVSKLILAMRPFSTSTCILGYSVRSSPSLSIKGMLMLPWYEYSLIGYKRTASPYNPFSLGFKESPTVKPLKVNLMSLVLKLSATSCKLSFSCNSLFTPLVLQEASTKTIVKTDDNKCFISRICSAINKQTL